MSGHLRAWLHARNELRRRAPGRKWKYLHDLDALGVCKRTATLHEQIRIRGIEGRYYDRLNAQAHQKANED